MDDPRGEDPPERGIPTLACAILAAGWRIEYDDDAEEPEVFAPAGEVPVLVVPRRAHTREVDRAAGWAICAVFEARYGWDALVGALGAWDALVRSLGLGRAAD